MAKHQHYDYKQSVIEPIFLEDQLVPGTLEYAIHYIVEERLDMSVFDARYNNDETGRKSIDPKLLLKIVLYGYSRGMISSRSLEYACQKITTFMALACNKTPDHSTIAAFVSSIDEEIEDLFTMVLMICHEEGLLGGTHFSIDGLKLSSNASKEWSGKFDDLKKKQDALRRKVKQIVKEHKRTDKKERGKSPTDKERLKKQIKKLSQQADRIEQFLSENEPKIGSTGKEIQSNVTDNESAKMATSHGVLQGYNANAMVDDKNQIITSAQVFGSGTDTKAMAPMLEEARNNLEAAGIEDPLEGKTVSADTGYYSVENLEACEDEKVDAYVPDQQFRKRDVRFKDAGRHRRSIDKHHQRYKSKKRFFDVNDFKLNEDTGKLVCPGGKELYVKNRNFADAAGYKYIAYEAPKTACRNCKLRSKCLRNAKTQSRQVHILQKKRPPSITDKMREKIDTPEGRKIYSKRIAIVEPVFGNIRACKKMDRFTLRGKAKVNIQWKLYCLVHNIEKILNYGKCFAVA
jgi:transposase/cytochrome c556